MTPSQRPPLLRAVGLFSLIAIAVNGMVGSGIFVLPAQVAKLLGPAGISAYLVAGLAAGLIVLCFAEVGALFDRSGGPYLYARAAFGEFVGFEIGWMMLLARLTAMAAICNAFASYLGFFWPWAAAGAGRVIVILGSIAFLTIINYRGVQYGTWTVNLLTVSKLAPLLIFVVAGLFFLDPQRPPAWSIPQPAALRQASLLLIFAFGGFEFAVVPGEEVIRPRRNIPIALLTGIGFVAALYVMIQFVAQSTLPESGIVGDAAGVSEPELSRTPGRHLADSRRGVFHHRDQQRTDAGDSADSVRNGGRRAASADFRPRASALPDALCRDHRDGAARLGLRHVQRIRIARSHQRHRAPAHLHGHQRGIAGAAPQDAGCAALVQRAGGRDDSDCAVAISIWLLTGSTQSANYRSAPRRCWRARWSIVHCSDRARSSRPAAW